jgi:flagellar basal-body rod protein FlgG
MNGAFYIGATGLDAEQRALDVVANNIANINTVGFKRSSAQFSALLGSDAPQSLDPSGSQPLLGVGVDTSAIDFSQGQITQTGQALNLAISGTGFIELLGPAGQTQLWRGGVLEINSDGLLAASNGTPLKAMISVPSDASAVTINADGSVIAVGGGSNGKLIGQIDLVQDKNLSALTPISGGFYVPGSPNDLTSAAPGVDGGGVLQQGALETSNVDLSNEMVTLLLLQRAYTANAQAVQAGDQLMAIANGLRR